MFFFPFRRVSGFSAIKSAGHRDTHRVSLTSPSDLDRSLYYALVAVDAGGNAGEASNVQRAYMPSPAVVQGRNGQGGFSG